MSSVVNLRLVRKRKAREAKEQAASENRVLHGRSKSEKTRDLLQSEKSTAFIEGHRRDGQNPDGKP